MDNLLQSLDAAAHTDPGLKRDRNEDTNHMLVPPPGVDQEALGALYVVADGMGGLGGGDVASRVGVDALVRAYYESRERVDPETRLRNALQAASIQVSQQASRVGLHRIGATAAGIVILPTGDGIVFNVGDCRVYRVRNKAIERVSRDQSVMEQQIAAGLSPEEASQKTSSSLVTGFLGQPVQLQPEIKVALTLKDDVYIICSDGLWSLINADEILHIVEKKPVEAASRQLIQLALKRGAPDNVTAIVVRVGKLAGFPVRKALGVFAALLLLLIILVTVDIALGLYPR